MKPVISIVLYYFSPPFQFLEKMKHICFQPKSRLQQASKIERRTEKFRTCKGVVTITDMEYEGIVREVEVGEK